jgi:hypothetical protein
MARRSLCARCLEQSLPPPFIRSTDAQMPGVKANTQAKGKEKEKVGGGGAAGIKARLGGGETRDCAMCVGKPTCSIIAAAGATRRRAPPAGGSPRPPGPPCARGLIPTRTLRCVRAWRSTRVHPSPPPGVLAAARSNLTSARRRHSSKRLVARARCQLHLPRAPV